MPASAPESDTALDLPQMAFVGKCLPQRAPAGQPTCSQPGAGWCQEKDDCQQFPNPCPGLDDGWYGPGGNATHMPSGPAFAPDSNRHEGWCSGDWTLGMVSDQLVIPKTLAPGKYVMSWRMDCEGAGSSIIPCTHCTDTELLGLGLSCDRDGADLAELCR